MYILEGNIGVGKSTFLSMIEQLLPSLPVVPEPVNSWNQQVHGQSLLAQFYAEPVRWAYTLETFAMACRMREHQKDEQRGLRNYIVERSIYSGHYCFAKNDYLSGYMSEIEWQVYTQWAAVVTRQCAVPAGFIYLKASPETLLERIKKRARAGEETISREYLEQIDARHDEFLIQKKDVAPAIAAVPVLVLDVNDNFEDSSERWQELVQQVQQFTLS